MLALAQRAELEREARRYADALGYVVDWEQVARLDDEMLVNGIAQIAPLDIGSKQALLEAPDLADRADLLVQFMQFQRMAPGGADGPRRCNERRGRSERHTGAASSTIRRDPPNAFEAEIRDIAGR